MKKWIEAFAMAVSFLALLAIGIAGFCALAMWSPWAAFITVAVIVVTWMMRSLEADSERRESDDHDESWYREEETEA